MGERGGTGNSTSVGGQVLKKKRRWIVRSFLFFASDIVSGRKTNTIGICYPLFSAFTHDLDINTGR